MEEVPAIRGRFGRRAPYVKFHIDSAGPVAEEQQHDLAESQFRGIIDAVPDSVEAWLEFGKFESFAEDSHMCAKYFEKAYSHQPLLQLGCLASASLQPFDVVSPLWE